MRMLRNKKALQKIIIALIILILFNFIFPMYSRASFWGGGSLFNPISELVCGIGDAIIGILQDWFLPGSPAAVNYKKPLDFIKEQLSDNVNKIIEQQAAKYSSGKEITEEEKQEMKKNLDAALKAREKVEYAAYITSDDNLATWLGGKIAAEMDDKFDKQVIPCIIYSPAAIFANMIPALDANFINPKVIYKGGTVNYYIDSDDQIKIKSYSPNPIGESDVDESNTAYVLQDTISTWYKALRNIAIVGLLSVLVYIAIRIIISSTSGETAKYKSMLKDWLVAMCILFFMHYMMAFLLKSAEMLTNLFASNGIIAESVEGLKIDTYMSNMRSEVVRVGTPGNEGVQFGYTLVYIVLVFYTLIFTWKYIKRLIYLAFLTLISPMIALTYPIDKLKDGSAQAFNKWFQEYVFNVLIQPIHMLLYTILVTSASSLAEKNMIYTIVAIGFMLEADNIIRDLFGIKFQRGEPSSPLTAGAMFGAGTSLVKSGLGLLNGGGSGSGGSGGSGGSDKGKMHFNDRDKDGDAGSPFDAFLDDKENDENSDVRQIDTRSRRYK